MTSNAQHILKHYWGYDSFRPPQDAIIQANLDSKDVLALLPTGAGKSICYQVPALVREGLCIVVSPLIALMKDQVLQLRKRGIRAGAIFSGLREAEIDGILNNCAVGHYKILYVSPERLGSDRFLLALKGLPVSMVAVDEAHCISQWGYDFRPSYREIKQIKDMFPNIPIMALTASATPRVQEDIIQSLQLREGFQRFQSSFERPNISFSVRMNMAKQEKILEILEKIPGTAIIYARNRRKTEDIAKFLNKNNVSATFYHAGLNNQERNNRQDAWIANKFRVISCTNAFGMGIDKPDVRVVIHADLPESLEAYYQEAGRAGRDSKKSYAVLLCNQEDKDQLLEQEAQRFPDFASVKRVYTALYNYLGIAYGGGKHHSFEFKLHLFAKQYHLDTLHVFNVLKLLEQSGYLQLNEAFYLPSRVCIQMNKSDLYKFQVEHAQLDTFIKMLLRTYEGIIGHFIKINESNLAKKLTIAEKDVIQVLKQLQRLGVLTYIQASDSPRITFLEERLSEDLLRLDHHFIAFSKEQLRIRIDAMIDYVEGGPDTCRQIIMRAYFGEDKPRPCGKCDLCLKRKTLLTSSPEQMRKRILSQVEAKGEEGLNMYQFLGKQGLETKEQYLDIFRILLDEDQLIWINEQEQIVGLP